MKRTNFAKLFALMLVLALMLTSCSGGGGKPYDPDEPVTAEPLVENFIEFEEDVAPIYVRSELIDKYGAAQSRFGDYVVFLKKTKDHLNNLTETYNVYSMKDDKVVLTLGNTYADEFSGFDKYDKPYRPPVTLSVSVSSRGGIEIITASYIYYTRMSEDVIEEICENGEDKGIQDFYYKSELTRFYGINGELLAESSVVSSFNTVGSTMRYTALSFGRTVVLFDRFDQSVIKTFDGDTERVAVPDYISEDYDYFLGQQTSYNGNATENKSNKLEVYNKNGKLKLSYTYSLDPNTNSFASVLDNGDIMIQTLSVTDALTPDAYWYGSPVNIETFLLDVESGELMNVDFEYFIAGNVMMREDILKQSDEEAMPTENVRNYASGMKIISGVEIATGYDSSVIFFDNLLNVNYVIEQNSNTESDGFMDGEYLGNGYRLITPVSEVTKKAIINADGKVVCYVPDGAYVTRSYIVTENAVYDFEMNLLHELDNSWAMAYKSASVYGTVGDFLIFNVKYTVIEDSEEITKDSVRFVYVGASSDGSENDGEDGYHDYYYDTMYYDYRCVDSGRGVAILRSTESETYMIIGGNGNVVLSVLSSSIPRICGEYGDYIVISYAKDGVTQYAKICADSTIGGEEE